jgi:hypothetical protein
MRGVCPSRIIREHPIGPIAGPSGGNSSADWRRFLGREQIKNFAAEWPSLTRSESKLSPQLSRKNHDDISGTRSFSFGLLRASVMVACVAFQLRVTAFVVLGRCPSLEPSSESFSFGVPDIAVAC